MFRALLILPSLLAAQEVEIYSAIRFEEGLYATIEDVKRNMPSHPVDSAKIHWYLGHDIYEHESENVTSIRKIKILRDNGKWERIKVRSIWGFAYRGKIYIQLQTSGLNLPPLSQATNSDDTIQGGSNYFNTPSYLGSICLLTNSKSAFRTSKLDHIMLKIETNEFAKLTVKNVGKFIADDEELFHRFQSKRQNKKSVYYYVNQYNLRNKTHLPVTK